MSWPHKYTGFGCGAAILGGLLAVAGWRFEVEVMKAWAPGLPTMKLSTAMGFMLLGGALACLRREPPARAARVIAFVLIGAVLLLSVGMLAEYGSGSGAGLNRWLLQYVGATGSEETDARPAMAVAGCFVLLGIALLLLATATRRGVPSAQWLGLLVSFIGFVQLLGYGFGFAIAHLFRVFATLSLPTSVLLMIVGLGVVLARPDRGFVTVLTSDYIGGRLLRRLLPIAVLVIVAAAWLRLQGELAGFYGLQVGLAIFASFNVVALSLAAWFAARHLNQQHAELQEQVMSKARSAAIVEFSVDAIIGQETDGIVTTWNSGAEKMFGYTEEEMRGRSIRALVVPERQAEHDQLLETIRRGERVQRIETERQRRDGGRMEVALSLAPIRDRTGAVVGLSEVVRDITAQKAAARALRESEERFAMAFKSSPVAIVISRRDTGVFLDTNEAFLRTFSYTREAVIGRSAVQFGMVSGDEFATMRNEVLAAPTLIDRERILRTGTGERVSVLASSELITLGGVACTLTTMIDITARKLAQDALRESEERLRLFILFAPAALAMFDRQMRYLAVSNRWLDDYGLGGRELLGLSHYEVFPEIGERWRAIHRRGFAGEVVRSEADRFERADGQVQWLKWEVRPWHDATGAVGGIVVFSEDITAQRQAKEQLQLHQAILEETGRIAKVGGWTFDVVTGAGTWTDEVARIHDLDPSAATSLNVGLSYYTETSRPKIEAAIRAAIDQAISYDLELELLSAKGVRKWVRTIGHPVVENGRVVRVNGSFQDITEQKKLEAQFLRGQRMEAIGTLASGVAHDLNNILSPMLMVAGLLKDEVGTKEGRAALGLVETSAHRGAAIIKQLLLFGRGHDGEKVVVAPVHLIKEMVGIARETFPREIGIIEKAPRDLWPVIGDPTQLHQVLLNLCVNARDAMRQGGRLILGGRNVTFDATSAPAFPDAKPGRYTLLTVEDTGEGIPAEIIARIFDPFFTTKELGRGTGLGLSTVQNIVKGHQGFVSVYSEAGRGTVFNVYLPAADAEAKPRGIDPGPTSVAGKQELILVVDDEAPIREAMRILLRKQGYRVLLAENGSDALSVFLENQNSIRLVITDVMMPVMGGVELTRRLRALHPALPIIATTGLEETTKQEELAEFGVVDLLPKPLELADLMDRIRRRLA